MSGVLFVLGLVVSCHLASSKPGFFRILGFAFLAGYVAEMVALGIVRGLS